MIYNQDQETLVSKAASELREAEWHVDFYLTANNAENEERAEQWLETARDSIQEYEETIDSDVDIDSDERRALSDLVALYETIKQRFSDAQRMTREIESLKRLCKEFL